MNRIVSVTPKDNHCLKVVLDNGERVMIDFTCKLNTVRFSMLSDKKYFSFHSRGLSPLPLGGGLRPREWKLKFKKKIRTLLL